MMAKMLLMVDGGLIAALSVMGWLSWRQLDELRGALRTQEVETGNRIALLQQLTCFDSLTGLRNHQMFVEVLARLVRARTPLALLYIDLDGLKQFNTVYGRQKRDSVIRSVAKAIRASLRRRTDRPNVFRRGTAADEFLVILELADLETGTILAEQILMALRQRAGAASIGVLAWDGQTHTCNDALERPAELQLQLAKDAGRNCIRASIASSAQTARTDNGIPEALPVDVTERVGVDEPIAQSESTAHHAA